MVELQPTNVVRKQFLLVVLYIKSTFLFWPLTESVAQQQHIFVVETGFYKTQQNLKYTRTKPDYKFTTKNCLQKLLPANPTVGITEVLHPEINTTLGSTFRQLQTYGKEISLFLKYKPMQCQIFYQKRSA